MQAEGPDFELSRALRALPGVLAVERNGDNRYQVAATRDLRPEAAKAIVPAGSRLLALDVEAPNLDDIYARYFEEVAHVPTA